MALTKVTGQVINDSTGLVVGVTTVGGGLSATDGFFSGIVTAVGNASFSGNVSVGGTLTYEDVTNIDAVGLVTARNGIVVGSGITLSKDGDGFFTGVVTATSYAGDGSALTGISVDSTQIVTGNTSVQTVDTGSDGHVKINTEGSERLRVASDGQVRINCSAQPSATVSGYQFDAGGFNALRISQGGGTSGTDSSSVTVYGGGSSTTVGAAAAAGASLNLINTNSTDNNQNSVDFSNSNSLSIAKVIGKNDSHSSRNGSLIFLTSSAAAPAERLRIGSAGQLGIGGANYGTSGQVLQSQGSGSAVQWATPSLWTHGARTDISGSDGYTFTGVADGASHIRYLISYFSASESSQPNLRLEKSTTGGSKSIISSGYWSYSTYLRQGSSGGGAKTTSVELWYGMTNASNQLSGTIDIYRLGSNGHEYIINFQGFIRYSGTDYAVAQANGYVDLGSSSTDFISGARLYLNSGTIDGGYASQSYQTP